LRTDQNQEEDSGAKSFPVVGAPQAIADVKRGMYCGNFGTAPIGGLWTKAKWIRKRYAVTRVLSRKINTRSNGDNTSVTRRSWISRLRCFVATPLSRIIWELSTWQKRNVVL
jgi:hypothetical protein